MLITVLRLYHLLRIYCFYISKWNTTQSQEICNKHNVKVGVLFVLKCQFKKTPFNYIFVFILTVGIISAFCIRIFERSYYSSDPIIDSSFEGY